MPDKVALTPSLAHIHAWSLVLATCADEQGRPNIITLGAASPCSARPPTIGLAVAPARYSHGLIKERGEFGANIPRRADLERADLCGCVSGREVDKFAETGFTPMPAEKISVPLIAECPINFECRLVHTVELGSHDWFIGEIVAVHADADILNEAHTRIDLDKFDGVLCAFSHYVEQGPTIAGWGFAARK